MSIANPSLPSETGEPTAAAWNMIASGYDAVVTPTHLWLAEQALRRAQVEPGTLFLDVAAGSGALTIPALRRGARVLAVDISSVMLDRLQARAAEAGLGDGVETRVMDGHALELEDDVFDVCGSQFGVMLFPDLPLGVREMARVTRPDGRVLVVAYGPPSEVEFIAFFMAAVQAVVPDFPGLPADPPPLPFQVADPGRLRQALAQAGLRDVRVDTVTERLEFKSGEGLWQWLMNSNPIPAALLKGTTEDQRDGIRRELARLVEQRAQGNDTAVLTNPVHIGIGSK